MNVSVGTRVIALRCAVFSLGMLAPIAVWAACTCGFGDGRFTLVTINIDGDMTDWAPVHADTDNNVCDGPINGLVDRDAPVQSTGRDLTHFAFTFDANNIYLFTERSGSVNNTQSFVYYADTDNDGLMQTGEPVIGVTWNGSNRNINVYVYDYVAQAGGGDPMVDAGGFADGFTLPGSFANIPPAGNPTRSGTWGSASGSQMEFYVAWAELGLAPNTPFSFHVASSNASLGSNNFTAQIDDNLAGCGGGPGSMVQTGVIYTPDLALTGVIGQTAVAVHTLTNDGNASEHFDFSEVLTGAFTPTVSYYEDTDASNTLTAGDTLLTDTDGDSLPNTGTIAPGASITVLAVYGIPLSASTGQVATVESTATSNSQPLASDSITDTITALEGPSFRVTKSVSTISDPVNLGVNPFSIPGSVVEYAVTVANEGSGAADADSFGISDSIPADSCMVVADIGGPGSGPVLFVDGSPGSNLDYTFIALDSAVDDIAFSDNGGSTYDYEPSPGANGCDAAVTNIVINPTGAFAADNGSGSPEAQFLFRVIVN